jgi:hypothetical protein
MTARLSRKELYDLVWSEPMKTLSARFGISDVGLKKTCARADIPTPERGYWAKKDAGKKTFQLPLPARAPGMDEEILIAAGARYWYHEWTREELLGPLPPPPEFPESIDAVRERIAKTLGRVTVPHSVSTWHAAVGRLLEEDDERREKQRRASSPMSWDNPLFDSPFERRRLRILNSLFFAVARVNGRPVFYGREAREINIFFYQQRVSMTLDGPQSSHRRGRQVPTGSAGSDNEKSLSFSILDPSSSGKARMSWQDDESGKLESRMTEIAIEVVLSAEIQYRESAVRKFQWRVQRKVELEEEDRKRKIEIERAERERQKRIEQARIDRLLRDARAFQHAGEIRKYVEAIRSALGNEACSSPGFEQWSEWALAQADRIDPAVDGKFHSAEQDEDDTTS